MKVLACINETVEVDVSVEDLLLELPGAIGNEKSLREVLSLINRCYAVLRTVPDAMLETMTPVQRAMIASGLREQAERYAPPQS